MAVVRHKEAIHSGHFMVSDFEAEAEDEEDLSVPPPEEGCNNLPQLMAAAEAADECITDGIETTPQVVLPEPKLPQVIMHQISHNHSAQAIIDISLNKLFQSMSIAYRQKLTSPKWNRFRGLKLRWKDKIRLNNVIWRCWHLQFIKGRNRNLLCAFANPLEIDNHTFPEGGTVLEGKYWKRKLQTITREYMRWRMFYKNRGGGEEGELTDKQWDLIFQSPFQMLEGSKDDAALEALAPEEDFFVDALFSTLHFDGTVRASAAAVPFASSREMNKKPTNSDFIQPCLAPLQPNLDDFFMELDSQSVFPDWQLSKLLTIQESSESPLSSLGFSPSNGGGGYTQFQPQQNFVTASKAKTTPSLGLGTSSGENQMLTYPFQSPPNTSVVSSNLMLMDQRPAQQYLQPQQQQRLDLPVPMQQQQQQDYSTAVGLYSYSPPLKKLTGPITCTSEKRHSPKHRILHHRDYLALEPPSSSSQQGSYDGIVYSGKSTNTGLLESASPYKLPVATAATSVSSAQTMSFLETRVKTRSYSGPCDVHSSALHPSPAVRSVNPNSELVQLLKSSKSSINPSPQQPTHCRNPHTLNISQLRILDQSGSTVTGIPPPPASSAPQPRIEVTPPSSRGDHDSSVGSSFRGRTDTPQYQEHRRSIHISSEQKRRGSIKNGFELLRSLIPSLSQTSSAKISKAALLVKGGDYLQQLKLERDQLSNEINEHREEVERLNTDIAGLQSSMSSSNGASVCLSSDSMEQMRALFDSHVQRCTMQNWKYWVFSMVMRPLLSSFHSAVKAGSFEETARTSSNWIDQHLSLVQLRPTVLISLKELSTSTDILNEPKRLPEEAVRAAAGVRASSIPAEAEDEEDPSSSQEFETKEEFYD